MKVDVVSRKLIKPCTPTPSNLRTYKISLIDELNPSMNVFRILYYSDAKKLVALEESLAKVLAIFYPLAGRYMKEKHLVDCNDEGAEFAEALVHCELHQLIDAEVIVPKQLNHLLPIGIGEADDPTDPVLAVQISKFQCGGVAIGVCASHRIFDSASLGVFLQAWANAAGGGDLDAIRPDFDSPSLFPSENLPPLDMGLSRTGDDTIVTKRFVFDKSTISKLRDSIWESSSSTSCRPPSRVALVSSVLTQALLRAAAAKHGHPTSLLIAQAINVRERTVPPVSKHACGSWVSNSYVEYTASESQSLEHFVSKMREATIKDIQNCSRIFSDKEFGRWLLVDSYFEALEKASSPNTRLVWNTDWTKFGEYELDFGFGKSVWVSLAAVPLKDIFHLMNTKCKTGIEAWVCLHESDMHYLEQDQDLKMLTTK